MKKLLFINGRWKEGSGYRTLHAPYSGEPIAEVAIAGGPEAEEAIRSACEAEEAMRELPAHRRAAILRQVSDDLQNNLEEAAVLIAREAGKPLRTARAEVQRAIQTYAFAAEEAKRINGHTISMDAVPEGEGRSAYTLHEPVGTVAAITPFNFPMNLVAHKIGPAIAAGNPVVLKPSELTPLSALYVAELFDRAGLPKGALNVINGPGELAERLVTDDRIKLVTFTGSAAVGKLICSKAGLKKVVLELGSNAALIIDRGVNPVPVAERCVPAAFSYQGQVCISLQRVYVHESLIDRFLAELIRRTRMLKPGDPTDPATDISAMISPRETCRVLEWIEEAKRHGAIVHAGGEARDGVLMPTILTGVRPDMKLSCEEAFGPVLIVHAFRTLEEAIAEVNDSKYGLQAGVFTRNVETVSTCVRKLRVGGVIVNDVPTFRVDHMPYGGVKQSGLGREGVKYAIEEMSVMKLVVQNHSVEHAL